MTVLATYLFSVDGQIDDGVNWDSIVDSVWAAGSGIAKVTAGNLSADWMLDYIGATWPADQYAQVTLVSPDAAGGLGEGYGPACRITSAGGGTFYRLVGNGSGWELSRFAGGSNAGSIASGSSPTFANGDVLRMEVQGTTLRMYKNGAQFGGDQTNANIATGHAGISYSSTETSTAGVDNFEGGDFTGGGTVNTQTLEDSIAVSDPAIVSQVRSRIHQDTITAVTDGMVASAIRGFFGSDTLTAADESVLFYRRNRLLESTISITDEALASIVGNNILTKILSSQIDVSDGAVLSIIRKRLLQDTIIVTEGSTDQYINTNVVVDDIIDVTDSTLARLIYRRLLGDNLTITDEALATLVGQNVITKMLTSQIDTFDEALRWMNRSRLGESVVLTSDEIVKVMRFTRELTDAIDAIDQAQTAMQRFILLTDLLSVQDDAVASYIPPIGPATYNPIIRIGFDQPRIELGGYGLN